MTERYVQLNVVGSEVLSPPIRLSNRALALAQDINGLMERKKDQTLPAEFQLDSLKLLASYIRPEVLQLAIAMEVKLSEKEKVGLGDSWKGLTFQDSVLRLLIELDELVAAVNSGAAPEKVWREAGDVGNFLMFMSRNYETRFYKNKEEKE